MKNKVYFLPSKENLLAYKQWHYYNLGNMVEEENRSGKTLRVIKKSLVDVNSSYFDKFKDLRLRGLMEDNSPKLFQNSCWTTSVLSHPIILDLKKSKNKGNL